MSEQQAGVIPIRHCRLLLNKLELLGKEGRLFVEEPPDKTKAGNLTDIGRAVFVHLISLIWKGQNPYSLTPSPRSIANMIEAADEFLAIFEEKPEEEGSSGPSPGESQ